MTRVKQIILGFALAAGAFSAGPALADRAPTTEELSRIENALRNEGFTRWGEIELDHGLWEVDDAYAADGRKYELKLHPDTLAIIRRKPD